MRKIHVVVHVADVNLEHPERAIVKAEIVARIKGKGYIRYAWHSRLKEEVELNIALIDWWNNSRLPLYVLQFEKVSHELKALNIFDIYSKKS